MREIMCVVAVIVLGLAAYAISPQGIETQWEQDVANQKEVIRKLWEDRRKPLSPSRDDRD